MENCTYNIIVNARIVLFRNAYEGWIIKERTIPDHELVFITDGQGKVITHGNEYTVKKGDLFYFYPGLSHSLELTTPPYMSFYAVHFSADNILPIKPHTEINNFSVICDSFRALYNTFLRKELLWNLKQNLDLQILIYNILKDAAFYSLPPSNIMILNKAIDYIENNYESDITMKTLTDITSCKKTMLTKIFNSGTGFSPIQYVIRMRLDKSKEHLLENHLTIKEIAGVCGFFDEFYYSKLFKKHYGLSPKQFRVCLKNQ